MAAPDRPASLRPGLLARKGEARPAMRPNGLAAALVEDDDLGWNDYGADPAAVPPVLRQRAQLQTLMPGSDALPTTAPDGTAVTITLDADRLWRLRMAAAAQRQSVEAWLVAAIDRFLPPPSDGAAPDPLPKVQP